MTPMFASDNKIITNLITVPKQEVKLYLGCCQRKARLEIDRLDIIVVQTGHFRTSLLHLGGIAI